MKKTIDIEKLVQWAMRDELPKGQAVAASAWDIVTQYAALGVRVQTSGYCGDGFGFVPGAPHEDALIVADAVKALPVDARFEDIDDVRVLFGDFIGIAGDAIDVLMRATFDARSLVIGKSIAGARPAWQFEVPTPYQMFVPTMTKPRALVHGVDAQGDIVEVRRNEGRALKRDGAYNLAMSPRSPLQWLDPSPITIGECRAEYVAWHSALQMLARDLVGKLKEFEACAPAAAALPWIDGETPVSRVLSDGFPPGLLTVPLRLTPDRGGSRKPLPDPSPSAVRFADPANYRPQPTSKTRAAIA